MESYPKLVYNALNKHSTQIKKSRTDLSFRGSQMLPLKMPISFSWLATHCEREHIKDISIVAGISEGGHSTPGLDLVQMHRF